MKSDAQKISLAARALAKAEGVKIKTSKYYRTTTVTFLTQPSLELIEKIKALSTCEAHGDIMDDTRWYSGHSVQVRFEYEVSPEVKAEADKLHQEIAAWNDSHHIKYYHFDKAMEEKGPAFFPIRNTYSF